MTAGQLIMFVASMYMAATQEAGIMENWRFSDWYLATIRYEPHEATYWEPRGQHSVCSYVSFFRVWQHWEEMFGRVPLECQSLLRESRIGTRYHEDRSLLGMYNTRTKDLSVHVTEYARHGPYMTMAHEWIHAMEHCATDTTDRVQREHRTTALWERHSGRESLEWQVKFGYPIIDRAQCAPTQAPIDKQGTYAGPPPSFN